MQICKKEIHQNYCLVIFLAHIFITQCPPYNVNNLSANLLFNLLCVQNRCQSIEENASSSGKTRHSSQEGATATASRSRPKPISRTRSSPLVSLTTAGTAAKTGLAWDPVMLEHSCLCGDQLLHPESPDRLLKIINKLRDNGVLSR